MTKLAIAIYRFLKSHKAIMYVLLVASFAFFVTTGLKMQYEEDITRLLPQTKTDNGESMVFSNLKVKDKIYIVFKPKADSVGTERLIECCDMLVDSMMVADSANHYIANTLYKVDQSVMMNAMGFLMESLPTYIEQSDYKLIDSLISKENVAAKMEENYGLLYSPMGMMMKDLMSRDPLGMKDVLMKKMDKVKEGLGGNYTLYENHFFTPDTALAIAFVSPSFASTDSKKSIKLIEGMESIINEVGELYPDVDIYYHGSPIQSVYNSRQTKKDLAHTLSISLVIICIVIAFCFKNWDSLPMMLIPVLYGTFFSLSTMYLLQGSMSLLALGIGGVVLGVALSYCLHVLVHYKYVSDPETVIKDQATPVTLGCLTTIGAFMSLMFTDADLLKDFGKFASLALVGTTFFSLVFLPHFFNKEKNQKNEKAFRKLEDINSYQFEKKTWLIITIATISIVCIATSSLVKFDTDLKNIGYNEPRVLESQQIVADHSTKEYRTVYYATISSDIDSALTFNKTLYAELEREKDNGRVKSFGKSATLFVTETEQRVRIEDWKRFWNQKNDGKPSRLEIVRSRMEAECSKYGFTMDLFDPFFNMIEREYQTTSLFDSDALPDGLKSNIVEKTDGKYIMFTPVLIKHQDEKALEEEGLRSDRKIVTDKIVNTEVMGKKRFVIIDPFYYTSELVKIMNHDFNYTLAISSAFVFLVLLWSFRSVVLALIGFIPMSLSWYIVLGVMGIFGIEFNLVNIVISTFIYGIGVDYSIFIMDGLLSGFRTRKQLLVYHKTAILFSAFVLIIGVSSLIFATHPAMKSIGVATLIGMNATVIIAYSLPPFLFYWFIKRRELRGHAPVTVYNLLHPKSFFVDEGMNDIQSLINNYEYKGREAEQGIRADLKATKKYLSFIPLIHTTNSMLHYACGYGYVSYWFNLKNDRIKTVAFDKDENKVTIAGYCYLKNDRILFTTEESVLDEGYEMVVVDGSIEGCDEKLMTILPKAKTVVVRNECADKFQSAIDANGFAKKDSNELYTIYKK